MLTVNGVKGTPKNFDNFKKEEKNASASEGSKAFGKEGITDKCRNGVCGGVRKWATGINETVKGAWDVRAVEKSG